MATEIWGHRGSSHTYIENTLAAFSQTIKDGAEGIELDVQRTKDGKLVVYHDENLKRLTGLDKFLWELTWKEIQELTLSTKNKKINYPNISNTKIPILEEVLNFMKETDLRINIELKNSLNFYPGMEKEIVELVDEMAMQKQVLYSSFNHASMHKMSALVGSKYCAILTSDIQHDPIKYIQATNVGAYHPMINSLQNVQLLKAYQKNNIKVHVWTADEEAHIYAGLLLGVDAIITNKPKKAIQLREQFQMDGEERALNSIKALGIQI